MRVSSVSDVSELTTTHRKTNVSDNAFAAFVLLAYGVVQLFAMAHHEMWRVELQAWLIARDSGDFYTLIQNARFEGHPILWHWLLFTIARFTSDPVAMQVAHFVIASTVVWMFARYAPFARWQKLVFAFSYYPLFEYGTISRCYALGNLALFAFCALYCKRPNKVLWLFCLLAILANTSVYGLIISGALVVGLVATKISDWIVAKRIIQPIAGFSIWLAASICSAIQIVGARFAEHVDFATPGLKVLTKAPGVHHGIVYYAQKFESWLYPLWQAYVPVSKFSDHPWNTTFFRTDSFAETSLWSACSLALVAILIPAFRKSKLAIITFALCTVPMLIIGFPAVRHRGILFWVLMASVWLARITVPVIDRQTARIKTAELCLSVLLVIQLAVGIGFVWLDAARPFSSGRLVGDFVRTNGLTDMTIMGTPDWLVAPIGAWIDRKVVFCERMEQKSFQSWDNRVVPPKTDDELYARVAKLMDERGLKKCLFVKGVAKSFSDRRFRSTKLVSFTNSIVPLEDYSVYMLERIESEN